MTLRYVLIGDGESPHLLKWASALAPHVDLWAASSRGFMAGFDALLPTERRLALGTRPGFTGGNVAVLRVLPRLARWLAGIQPDWIHAHYLTSHGTLAWLAKRVWRVPGRLAGSAWGSDILVAPQRSVALRWVTRHVLAACDITTSDSLHMAQRMRELGAREVMTFPFGLEALPELPGDKEPALFFANRGLESIYAPAQVIRCFAEVAGRWPDAQLVVANDGALRSALEEQVASMGLAAHVRFVGRLDAEAQRHWYRRAQWFISLPISDSVSVSVLEAMAHGCIPILSDLPANRELVRDGDNGLIVDSQQQDLLDRLQRLSSRARAIAQANHAWIGSHAVFPDDVGRFLERLQLITRQS